MPPLQIGLDIATSLSVVGAAVAFIASQLGQTRNTRALAFRQQRVENMSRLLGDFSRVLEAGDRVVAKVRMAQAGRQVDVSPDEFTNFCGEVDRYIRINSALLFQVWASESERAHLKKIHDLVHDWNRTFVEAVAKRDRGIDAPVPSFDKLVADLTVLVTSFSASLRAEVERVVV